ncbi:hypothetical protein GTO27_11005 [Candidatus Bathyarchaeota archaeon]|nr:hypothetical protein [Candidatus Bathyarchaeota archaeon]
MTILAVEKWVAKPEKQKEHTQIMQKFRKFIKDNPAKFKEVKSIKEFTQMFGDISGMHIWLVEYDSLADYERLNARMNKDKGAAKLNQEWLELIDPTTVSVDIWSTTTK